MVLVSLLNTEETQDDLEVPLVFASQRRPSWPLAGLFKQVASLPGDQSSFLSPSWPLAGLLGQPTSPASSPTVGPAEPPSRPRGSAREGTDKLGQAATVLTMINAIIGVGALGLPYVVQRAGIALTIIILCAVVPMMTMTAIFLIRSIAEAKEHCLDVEKDHENVDFGFLGEVAFGRHGRKLINGVFILQTWLVVVNYFVLIGININFCAPIISRGNGIAGSAVFTFALLYVPVRMLGVLSSISVMVNLMLMAVLVWAGMSLPELAVEKEALVWQNPEGAVRALGVLLFCFASHPYIPSIYAKARKPEKFAGVLGMAFTSSGAYVGACGVLGYIFYGSAIAQSFTVNLGNNLEGQPVQGERVLPFAFVGCLLVKLQFQMPILATPLLTAVCRTSCWWDKMIFVVITCYAAITFREYLDSVMSFTGLVATMTTCVIFPILVYVRLIRPHMAIRYALLALCVASAIFAITGTIQIIRSSMS